MIRRSREQSALGDWKMTELRPACLAGFVDAIWYFDGALSYRRERHFPTGTVDLIVHLDEPFRIVQGEPPGVCPAVCIGGLLVAPQVIEAPPGRCRVLGVRLLPAGAYALLRAPLSEITGRTVDLCEFLGRAAQELGERCDDAASDDAVVRTVEAWLERQILVDGDVDRRITVAAGRIRQLRGSVRIARVRAEVGLSSRRMASAFREQIGVTPKVYARIVRFGRAAALLRAGSHSLATLALEAGYYDQPHMNAEFRELSGLSPGEFLTRTHFPEAISLAE